MNAVEIEEAVSRLTEAPFDPENFPYAFLEAFGNKETTLKRLRTGNTNHSDVSGAILQRNNIHIKVCLPGDVSTTLNVLRESPATQRHKVKFILATDGTYLEAEDLSEGGTVAGALSELADKFGFFLALAGISTVKQISENGFDIKATGRLNRLYIELLKDNPSWDTADRRQDLNHFFARLIFCFFAEDTSIFLRPSLFTDTLEKMTDASNTNEVLSEIFRAMNTSADDRKTAKIKSWANEFPYVNGGLFSGSIETPHFSKIARSYLLHVGSLDWTKINPDIFGSMIQAVADDEERGALGMHYTSVPNILKVLNPLFLDDLREQLRVATENPRKLLNLRQRLSRIRVFDPACGSGNFLVIAYKQMREIEADINRQRGEQARRTDIPLTNFRGIEVRHFSAEIARLALIIAEYQCDVLHRGQQLALAEFLPLEAANWITCGNALRLDWQSICPPAAKDVEIRGDELFSSFQGQAEVDFKHEGGETYICGNPPYQGSMNQTRDQKEDMASVFAKYLKTYKDLDYVSTWLVKAAEYTQSIDSSCAFVTTNSVCQGEQVGMLWPILFKLKQKIFFAHTSFKWSNNASNNAGVTCIVLGLRKEPVNKALLFDGATSRAVSNIGPYLIPNTEIIVSKSSHQICGLPEMVSGNKATDGGHLIFSYDQKGEVLRYFPKAKRFFRRLEGAKEFIQGSLRWCLWLRDEDMPEVVDIPVLNDRIESVKRARAQSRGKQANDWAKTPHKFVYAPHRPGLGILIPFVSSEHRQYLPCGLFDDRTVIVAPNQAIYDAQIWCLSVLSSRLHLTWIATVCGKLETRYRYSNALGWNTFPVPTLTEQNKIDLTRSAEEILLAREAHFPASIAELYDPDTMPPDLRQCHEKNDEILERIYIGRRFKNDTERLEKLFELYTKISPKVSTLKKKANSAKVSTNQMTIL